MVYLVGYCYFLLITFCCLFAVSCYFQNKPVTTILNFTHPIIIMSLNLLLNHLPNHFNHHLQPSCLIPNLISLSLNRLFPPIIHHPLIHLILTAQLLITIITKKMINQLRLISRMILTTNLIRLVHLMHQVDYRCLSLISLRIVVNCFISPIEIILPLNQPIL